LQVTFFKCGGVALGVASHHAAVDGISTFHFIKTWSAFSRVGDGASIELPCHDRTLLRARSPPVVHPDAVSVLYPKVTLSQSSSRPNATEVFPISRDQLVTLKRLCGGASTFCSVSALVWKCASIARRLPGQRPTTRSSEAAAPGPLLRQRVGLAVRRRCFDGSGICCRSHQRGPRQDG
jgi:shikimate O-hydroxycinnamoyltransferase